MTTLAVDTPRNFGQGIMNDLPVIASDIIYEGAFVGENASGYSRPLVATDPFQGVCVRQADNSDGAAGDINVRVKASGILSNMAVTGATAITANDFPPVYASDDGTLTLTASTNTMIGNVLRWISSGICDVSFSTPRPPSTVTVSDMGANSVDSDQYVDGSIDLAHMSANSIDSDQYVDASIDLAHMSVNSIDSDQYVDASIDLAHLSAGITPTHVPLYGGQITTGGGNAVEAETIAGIVATDYAIVTMVVDGTNNVTLLQSACTTDTLTITFSGDPSSDAIYNYLIFRAAA